MHFTIYQAFNKLNRVVHACIYIYKRTKIAKSEGREFWYSWLFHWTNIGIHDCSSWDHLGFRKLASRCENFKIQNLSRPKFIKCKVDQNTLVDLDEFNNLGTHHFCIWNILGLPKLQSKCHFFKIWDLTWSIEPPNDHKSKHFEYKNCTTHEYLHLINKSFLHLRKYCVRY